MDCEFKEGIFGDRIVGVMGELVVDLCDFFVIFVFAEVKEVVSIFVIVVVMVHFFSFFLDSGCNLG